MAVTASRHPRVNVDGKFFRFGGRKLYVKGVAYGPFQPNAAGEPFGSPEQTAADFAHIRELGANLVRVYHVPGKWFLDLAVQNGLKVLIDIPWNQHLCFLDSAEERNRAREAVRRAVFSCARHPAVFAYSVANEIPADIVRWCGEQEVAAFIDELVWEAKRVDPDCLCTYTNFPPTEFLAPSAIDFVCFNVYLHQRPAFRSYLARLQTLSESKPLLLGETGVDSIREGEARKCEMLRWQIHDAFRGGLAGTIVFNYTDDWWRGGRRVEDWQMGLTSVSRQPKPSFSAVQEMFATAPYFPLPRTPKVSVVVASYNAERTLVSCLDSLMSLNYAEYEVILVDDGSTDETAKIAARYPTVRCLRHPQNLGLSVARNTGIAASGGEIIAFTDSDCRADEDWLYYIVGDLLESDCAAIGGPNLLPPEDSAVAAAVMASPGGPAHVMLTDRQAEHVPGCNLAAYTWAFAELGGFDPIFLRAGDDVDVCWRLQQAGHKIGFSPAGFVWHYRRSTVGDYLRQQQGYGEAEALLVRKHPEYFNFLGGSIWRGRIYAGANPGLLLRRSVIYRGLFGSAGFQSVYHAEPALGLMFCTTLEYHVLITGPLWIVSVMFHPLLPLAIASSLISLGICATAAAQAVLPRNRARWWSRPLVGLLFLLQPVVRGWARYKGGLTAGLGVTAPQQNLDTVALRDSAHSLEVVEYWAEQRLDRLRLIHEILLRLEQQGWPKRADIGWGDYDVEIYGPPWSRLEIITAAEEHPEGKQLIRFRLRTRWAMRATLIFWILCAVLVLVLGVTAKLHPSLWALLILPAAAIWFLRRQQRTLQSVVIVLLDKLAKDWGMVKMGASAITPPSPAAELKPASPLPGSPFAEPKQP
jgi:glycosyltransferase involved in cell wall biosynthesis